MYIFQHMSYIPKPQFWSRIGSPWLGLGSNLARMNPTASRNLFKRLPALREPVFGPKSKKNVKKKPHSYRLRLGFTYCFFPMPNSEPWKKYTVEGPNEHLIK